ncbi:MAG TPA: TetR/AcrR family transcriptional regulator [Solirubrobacteraceae bacterium]
MATTRPDPARRNERSRQAILKAAFELCAERSYERTSVEAIAARAGVGKQTIYRWWPSKGAVVMEALNDYVGAASDFPDSGDVVADLRRQMTAVAELLSSPGFGPVYTGVIGAAQSDPALAEALVRDIIEPRMRACRTRLERAREQGEVRPGADLEAAVELLYGPIYHRLLLHTRPVSAEQVPTVLELAFRGIGPDRSPA